MKLGISSYTFTWAVGVPGSIPESPLSVYDLLEKAARSGIRLLQIADNIPLENLSNDELRSLCDYSQERGVNIEVGGRGLTMEHTMKCLQTAEALRSPILRMVIDGLNFEPSTPEIKRIIRDMLPEFTTRKIKLALENHDRLNARQFEEIIQDTGSAMVGICLDSVNSMGAGEGFETVADILIPYTINLHIKDFVIYRATHKMGLVIEGRPAGKGMLNIPELIYKLSSTGKCESAILELWTPPEQTIENTIIKEEAWAIESLNYLKQLKWEI